MPVGDQYRLFPTKIVVKLRCSRNLKDVFVTSLFPTRRSAQVLAQEGDVVLSARIGGLADDRGVGGADHRDQQLRVDLTGAEVGVPVGTRPRRVAGVVAVHKVDASS